MTDIEDSAPCARGCAWAAASEDEPPRPKPAKHGLLCNSDFYRLTAALQLIPDLMANMRALIVPGGAQVLSERVSGGGDGSPAPLNLGPLDASDSLFAKLHSWIGVFSDEFRVARPAIPSWANEREVQGSRPVSVEAAHMLASWLCEWLLARAEDIAASTSIVAYYDDIITGHEDARGVFSLSAAYGVEPRPVREADKRQCPICGEVEIFCKRPDLLDPEVAIMCGRCEHVVNPASYAKYADLIEAVACA